MRNENTPAIETERLILRKYTLEDAAAFLEFMSDAQTNTFLPWFPLRTTKEAQEILSNRFLAYYDKLSAYRYAVCLKVDNKPIGYVWLSNDDSADFGYCLKKEFWHMGITEEAAKAVLDRIKDAGYPYITATHDVNNPRSGEIMKKLGMTYRYSYVENWQPKNIKVIFRMYQIGLNGNDQRTYMKYWEKYDEHFIEKL